MPVHVSIAPRSADETSVRLGGAGSVWTVVRFEGGPIDATVPWMPVDERARGLSWFVYSRKAGVDVATPLKPLNDHERLAGYAGVEANAALGIAQEIYPGDRITLVPLDPAMPMPGVAAAWEALDIAVLDPPAAQRIGEQRFASLVAGGTAFAVSAETNAAADTGAPWPHWPWKKQGGWNVMHYRPVGPSASTYSEAIYAPVSSWSSGWAAETRTGMFIYASVFSILVLLMALWRPRFSALAVIVLSGIFLGVLIEWGRHRRPGQTVGGKVRILSAGITQDDDWAYQTTHWLTYSTIRWVDTTRPMLASPRQLDDCAARIVCYPNGDPDYLFFNLPAKMKVAILSRRCGPQAPIVTPSAAITSPLAGMVQSMYLGSGDRIVGQFPSAPLIGEPYAPVLQWPAVMVTHDEKRAGQ